MDQKKYPMDIATLDGGASDIQKGFDWAFVCSIFDMRPFLFPVTQRKMLFASLYLSMVGAVVLMERSFAISKKINQALDENVLWLTVMTYGLEPFMLLLYMILARYPYFDPKLKTTQHFLSSHDLEMGQPNFHHDAVLVIPCHNSASGALEIKSLKKVIHAALLHFSAPHIIVVNNGSEDQPTDNTEEIIHAIHPDIICIYRAGDGNKSRAQLNGVELAIAHYGDRIQYVLLIDDDVQIPEHYVLDHSFFLDKHVRGIIYPILATSSDQKDTFLTRWQNIEYQLSDITLSALDAFKGALAPHGACVLLDIKTAHSILQRHTGRFKGEDKEIGEILRNLYHTEGSLKFRVDMAVHFKTVVPGSYLGHGDNLWKQRVRSWSEAPFLYWWSLVLKPLLADWRAPVQSLPMMKLTQSYYLLSQCSHIFRYYIIALEARNPKFWLTFASFSLVQLSIILLFNYKKLPPYLRNDFASTASFPIYKNIDNAMSHLAFWRAILFSIPAEPTVKTNLEKLQNGEIPPLQLHDEQMKRASESGREFMSKSLQRKHRKKSSHKQSSSHSSINKASETPLQKLSIYRATSAPEAHARTSRSGMNKANKEKKSGGITQDKSTFFI